MLSSIYSPKWHHNAVVLFTNLEQTTQGWRLGGQALPQGSIPIAIEDQGVISTIFGEDYTRRGRVKHDLAKIRVELFLSGDGYLLGVEGEFQAMMAYNSRGKSFLWEWLGSTVFGSDVEDLVVELVRRGADVNEVHDGRSLLDYVREQGENWEQSCLYETAAVLVKLGAKTAAELAAS